MVKGEGAKRFFLSLNNIYYLIFFLFLNTIDLKRKNILNINYNSLNLSYNILYEFVSNQILDIQLSKKYAKTMNFQVSLKITKISTFILYRYTL
jgi:hypothetical protein